MYAGYCTFSYISLTFYLVGNMVAPGTERSPDALTVSSDSRCLAFVGPSEYIVTIGDARTLDEVVCFLNLPPHAIVRYI